MTSRFAAIPMRAAFDTLRATLEKHAAGLIVKADTPTFYSVDAGYSEKWKKQVWFGGVRLGKSYVSYHLIPVYACPELLARISPDLKKRMQGKSCFNFKSVSAAQARELSKLTGQCVRRFKKVGQFKG